MGDAWYSTGVDAHEEELERRKKKQEEAGQFDRHDIRRFFIPQSATGEDQEVIFLDDSCFNVPMHHFQHNGEWGNWRTCPKKTGVANWCPLCERDNRTSLIGNYTVIDAGEWTATRGDGPDEVRMGGVKILPAKSKVSKLLERRKDRLGTLVGAKFAVERTSDDAVNTGDDWIFDGRVYEGEGGLCKFLEENLDKLKWSLDWFPEGEFYEGEGEEREYFLNSGLNFEEYLKPPEPDELQEFLVGGKSSSDSSGGSSGGSGQQQGDWTGNDGSATQGNPGY